MNRQRWLLAAVASMCVVTQPALAQNGRGGDSRPAPTAAPPAPSYVYPAAQAPGKVLPAPSAPGKTLPAAQAPGKTLPAAQAPGKSTPQA